MSGYHVTVKISDNKKAGNIRAIAQQLASILENLTNNRTVVQIKEAAGRAIKRKS